MKICDIIDAALSQNKSAEFDQVFFYIAVLNIFCINQNIRTPKTDFLLLDTSETAESMISNCLFEYIIRVYYTV